MKNEYNFEHLRFLHLKQAEPSYDFLEKICHAHLNTFAFENISKLIYFKQYKESFNIPSYELFLKNYSDFNFGGTCYTLNANLLILLRKLGFTCYLVMLGHEHKGIIVKIHNDRFYVDCGAAAPFFKPVRLSHDIPFSSEFGTDRVLIIPVEGALNQYRYVRYTNGVQNGKVWLFHALKEEDIYNFNDVIKNANKPEAPFMSMLRCQLYQTEKQRSVSLVNNLFKIQYANGDTINRTLISSKEVEEVLHEEFLLPKLPVTKAIDVLREMGIDIFNKVKHT